MQYLYYNLNYMDIRIILIAYPIHFNNLHSYFNSFEQFKNKL